MPRKPQKPKKPIRLDLDLETVTAAEAKRALRETAKANRRGCECFACGRTVTLNDRNRYLTDTMAGALKGLYQWDLEHPRDFAYTPDLLMGTRTIHGGDAAKLRHWGLTEPRGGERTDGSKRTGFWRITAKGIEFVEGRIQVPAFYIEIPETKSMVMCDDLISFQAALKVPFDFGMLIAGVPSHASGK